MKPWPRSLYGRLVIVLLAGLSLAQLAAGLIQFQDRGQSIYQATGMHTAQRIGNIVRVLDAYPASRRKALVEILNAPPFQVALGRVSWPDTSPGSGDDRHSALFRRAAHAFNTMQTRLSRYIEDRTRILAAISHDLKTPLTRLRLRADAIPDPDLRAAVLRDLEEMKDMTGSTLAFIRGLEDGEQVRPLDMGTLIDSVVEDARPLGREVTVRGAVSAPYPARAAALKRCLANLLDNAFKYAGQATLSIEDSPQELRLRISDDGPGIPEDSLETVFEPFYRLEPSRNRQTGGTGLGLSIARNIARAHGGDLLLENRPEGGLVATLTLPRS